jgi:hypothetical protein
VFTSTLHLSSLMNGKSPLVVVIDFLFCLQAERLGRRNSSAAKLVQAKLVQAATQNEGEGCRLLDLSLSGPSQTICVVRSADVCKMSACNINMEASTPTHNGANASA